MDSMAKFKHKSVSNPSSNHDSTVLINKNTQSENFTFI